MTRAESRLWILCTALVLGPGHLGAQNPEPSAKPEIKPTAQPPMQLEKFALILLKKGPKWNPHTTPEGERIQQEHLAHLRKLWEAGKPLVAGPFGDQADPTLRGMCLYRVDSPEEAKKLAQADPAVKARRLVVEAMSWYTEKGYLAFPKSPPPKPN